MNDVREVSLSLADQLRQDIRRQLVGLTMPLVSSLWSEHTFVYFESIPVGSKFKIAGCDRSKGIMSGFIKIKEVSCQEMQADSHNVMRLVSFQATASYIESGTEETVTVHYPILPDTPVILV